MQPAITSLVEFRLATAGASTLALGKKKKTMALIKCKECGAQISAKADACPQCGAKRKKSIGCGGVLFGCILLVAGIMIVGIVSTATNTSKPVASPSPTTATETSGEPKESILLIQKKIDDEFIQGCIDAGWVTYIEQNYTDNFYVRLPASKYTTKENIESIATYIAKAYVMQNKNKGGANKSATVHVFKGDEVVARGRYSL